jgi:hypothetical protein
MGDAAHVESPDHEVYHTPFAVQLEFETWNTPGNYRSYPGGDKLPDKMRIWRAQRTGKDAGGVVASCYGFTDSPDAEIIALGFNTGKNYGAVGIGRQGNFLMWGYSAPPSQMTEAGHNLFLNCIHYIRRFDGKTPLVHIQAMARSYLPVLTGIITRVTDDKKEFFLGLFPEELYEKYKADPDGLTRLYQTNVEWVYYDKVYRIDEELKSLGIDSNRKTETLQRLVALLDDPSQAATAKKLLGRYTNVSFDTPQQWRQWLDANKDRIYFTDVGGYKFLVVPEGYLAKK